MPSLCLKKLLQDFIGFFAGLNVPMPPIATVSQKMLSLHSVWETMTSILLRTNLCPDDVHWSPYSATMPHSLEQRVFPDIFRGSHSRATILVEGSEDTRKVDGANIVFTPVLLMQLLTRMWKSRLVDLAHSAGA